jgi:hypothetical protein
MRYLLLALLLAGFSLVAARDLTKGEQIALSAGLRIGKINKQIDDLNAQVADLEKQRKQIIDESQKAVDALTTGTTQTAQLKLTTHTLEKLPLEAVPNTTAPHKKK